MASVVSRLFKAHYHSTLLASFGLVLGVLIVLWAYWGASPIYLLGLCFFLVLLAFGWYVANYKTRNTNRVTGKFLLLICMVNFLMCLILINVTNSKVPEHLYFVQLKTPELIAHQGGNLESPDETIAAFDHAIAVGVESLELDVYLSKDGHLIVMHDAQVNRTTNGEGVIAELTLEYIKTLNPGYWWPYHGPENIAARAGQPDSEFPYRLAGLEVLTLTEVFERYPDQRIVVEIKQTGPEIISALGDLIQRFDRWQSTLVASFYLETMVRFRSDYPQALTSGTQPDILLFYILHRLHLASLFHSPFQVIQVPMRSAGLDIITPRFIKDAHQLGMKVHAWTINDVETMKKLIDWEIDGIITDRPELMINALK